MALNSFARGSDLASLLPSDCIIGLAQVRRSPESRSGVVEKRSNIAEIVQDLAANVAKIFGNCPSFALCLGIFLESRPITENRSCAKERILRQ